MIEDFLTEGMTLWRVSNELAGATPTAATIAIERQPAREAYIELSLANASVGGIVYVNGTSNSVAKTEGVTFASGSSVKRSLAAFSALNSLTLSGIAGGNLSARAVAAGGEPVTQEVAEEYFKGSIRAQSGRIRYLQQGSAMIADYELSRINSAYTAARKIITASGRRYEIVFVSQVGPHNNVLCDLHLLP